MEGFGSQAKQSQASGMPHRLWIFQVCSASQTLSFWMVLRLLGRDREEMRECKVLFPPFPLSRYSKPWEWFFKFFFFLVIKTKPGFPSHRRQCWDLKWAIQMPPAHFVFPTKPWFPTETQTGSVGPVQWCWLREWRKYIKNVGLQCWIIIIWFFQIMWNFFLAPNIEIKSTSLGASKRQSRHVKWFFCRLGKHWHINQVMARSRHGSLTGETQGVSTEQSENEWHHNVRGENLP